MNELFNKKVKIIPMVVALVMLAGSFYLLMHTDLPINFIIVLVAGLIGLVIMYGFDGMKKAYSPLKKGSLKVIILCYISTWFVGIGANYLGKIFNQIAVGNPVESDFTGDFMSIIIKLIKTGFMLAGEEILTMIPFILLVHFGFKLNWNRQLVIVIAILLSSVYFGALHLETYQWNFYQSVVIIGLIRIPFTVASLKLNSIWAGTVTHIAYDWSIFIFMAITSSI